MFRTFTLPLTADYQSIWQLLINAGFCDSLGNELVSSVKNDAIIPDRVSELDVRAADANTGVITYEDQQASPGTNQTLSNMSKRSGRNSICLKDYLFADSTAEDALVVEIESI